MGGWSNSTGKPVLSVWKVLLRVSSPTEPPTAPPTSPPTPLPLLHPLPLPLSLPLFLPVMCLTGGNSAVQIHQLSKWRTQVSTADLCVYNLNPISRVSVSLCVCMCVHIRMYMRACECMCMRVVCVCVCVCVHVCVFMHVTHGSLCVMCMYVRYLHCSCAHLFLL